MSIRNASAYLVVQVTNAILSYGVTAVLARVLSPADLGVYAFVLAMVTVLVLPAQFGLPSLVVREVAAANARGSWALMKGLIRQAHQFATGVGLVTASIVGLALLLAPRLRGIGDLSTLLWGLALVPLLPLSAVRGAMLRGLQRAALGQFPDQIVRPALFLLAVLIGGDLLTSAARAMALHVATTVVAFAVGVALFFRFRPTGIRTLRPEYATRRWLVSLLPMGLSNSMTLLNTQIGILTLGFVASPAEVGVYRVASQTALFVGIGYTALNATLSPDFADAFMRDDKGTLRRKAVLGSRAALALGIPLILLVWIWGPRILGLLFGADYATAYGALSILVVSYLISMVFGSAAALLNMTNHERDVAICSIAAVTANLALSLALVPVYGAKGAAWATVVTSLLLNVMLWWFAKRRLGVDSAFWAKPVPTA